VGLGKEFMALVVLTGDHLREMKFDDE